MHHLEMERYVQYHALRDVFICRDCGVMVTDRESHDRWHHEMADTIATIVVDAVTDAVVGFERSGSPGDGKDVAPACNA